MKASDMSEPRPRATTALPTVDAARKLNFLSRPEAFPDRPDHVDIIQTHFAWVFLSKELAYKLKKPIKLHEVDFSTIEKRRANCELEVVLNRRLAEDVYLGAVTLNRIEGGFELEADGEIVDWLVKMRRLPGDRTLDRLALAGKLESRALRSVVRKLAAFYERADRAPWLGTQYVRVLISQNLGYQESMLALNPPIALDGWERMLGAQLDVLERGCALLESRADQGRVVDAHGDLRPEHIFLAEEPQIIDCLEFAAELRFLDTASEIEFLALECERLGQVAIGKEIRLRYEEYCIDDVGPELRRFYRRQHALIRALLSAWHVNDRMSAESARHWIDRANWYIHAAQAGSDADGKRR